MSLPRTTHGTPDGRLPARWTRSHLALVTEDATTTAPRILGSPPRILPDLDIWDMWPIQEEDGSAAVVLGRELWMGLSAPAVGHPEDRHDVARIRLLSKNEDGWSDLGNVFPDGASMGSREWSGSAVRRRDGTVSVFYTATGQQGDARPTFTQRIVESRLTLKLDGDRIVLGADGEHREIVRPDGQRYLPADERTGGPGGIKAFRDPAWFLDPADGREHLLIAASAPWRGRDTGAVALASAWPGGWTLAPPLLTADGINREIERPHVVVHDCAYYLFCCTHGQSFEPPHAAPTGLYGWVAPRLTGPYEPLNGSGLVIGNPAAQPDQAYAWLVLDDLRVVSFLDYRPAAVAGPGARDAQAARSRFGGTIAPILRLALDGARSRVTAC